MELCLFSPYALIACEERPSAAHCIADMACFFLRHCKPLNFVQWSRGLRRVSMAARLLGLRVRIPPGAWMCLCCECCVWSGRGLYVELITRPEEFCRIGCVVVCDLETSRKRRPWPTGGWRAAREEKVISVYSRSTMESRNDLH